MTASEPTQLPASRAVGVDILRGLTMVLMVFVNDLWSVGGVPEWMLHVPAGVDGMGLSDVVFPAFLFIVGLSLPLAVDARIRKGDAVGGILLHVLSRSFALIVMGLFLVNGEKIDATATGMSRHLWYVCSCLCFLLLWNRYPPAWDRRVVWVLRALGGVCLLAMAFRYRGVGEGGAVHFRPHWWGILGLIGWSYLAAAVGYLAVQGRTGAVFILWECMAAVSIFHHMKLIPSWMYFIPEPVIGGTLTALVLGGAVAMRCFREWTAAVGLTRTTLRMSVACAGLLVLYLATRPYWGLAKLGATPAWLFLCSALTLAAFIAVEWLAVRWGGARWFGFARPAGEETLLTYFMPYFVYACTKAVGFQLPDVLLSGWPGLLKCLAFSLSCVWLAKGVALLGVRLRL